MDLDNRVARLDEELKLVKNEIKEVLLEIQEQVLNSDNPFSNIIAAAAPDHTAAIQQAPAPEPRSTPNAVEPLGEQSPQHGYQAYQAPVQPPPAAPVQPQPVAPAPSVYQVPQPSQPWGGVMESMAVGKQADMMGREADLRMREAELKLKESDLAADISTHAVRTVESRPQRAESTSSSEDAISKRPEVLDRDSTVIRNETSRMDGRVKEPGPSDGADTPTRDEVWIEAPMRDEVRNEAPIRDEIRDGVQRRLDRLEQPISQQEGRTIEENGRVEEEWPNTTVTVGPSRAEPVERDRPKVRAQKTASFERAETAEVVDLITVAALAQWTDIVLRKGGRAYLEALLDVSEMTGRVSKDMKETLLTFMRLQGDEVREGGINTREMVALLAQLDGLLGINTSSNSKLLPFLFHDKPETL